ncbi:hypothetical protein Syun_010618 [Stephania yunnanensis]|uniref:Calcineurin-like phosphoesterase domain-containing protein n=1 Tax=Stephania yunnanensis TaxID=152371 RepID=A0AAP0KIX7_9MAGN
MQIKIQLSAHYLMCFCAAFWAASLLYGEMVAYWVPSLWTCSWPHHHTRMAGGVPSLGSHMKVAVIADPQLMDRTSHALAPKSVALEIAQFYTDLYMRRAFLASVLPFKPHLIIFLGDYFDGGPYLLDEEWQESLTRFKHIFNLNHRGRRADIPVYYIPGNHDIGYTALHTYNTKVISRYEKEFGPRNHHFNVGKVEFVAIDAQTLDGLKHGSLTSTTWDFVKNMSMDDTRSPRVLLSHIPLYRPDWTPCGSHRASPIVNQRVSRAVHDQGITYQNYLTEETSNRLLDLIKPVLVLSGHDHDQCTATHKAQHGSVIEHTVGTFSWQQGNLYPSFMLLSVSSLANITKSEDAVSAQLCFLPMQTHIYIWYLSLFVFTMLVLLLWPMHGLGFLHQQIRILGCITRAIGSKTTKDGNKEKDDDESCEYEMVWDVEGTMHIIKKVVRNAGFKHSSEAGLVERGSAAVRPTAKKSISQKTEVSTSTGMSADLLSDDGRKSLQRSSKHKVDTLAKRFFRTLKSLMVIAAVNVPLYMMLLSKDWIEL